MNAKKFAVVLSILAVLIASSVVSVGALTPVHASLKAAYATGKINATVHAMDNLNKPISGASVQVSFEKEGLPVILHSGMTGKYGTVTISSAVPAGKWLVCIEEIRKIGYEYNPLQNTCTTLMVP